MDAITKLKALMKERGLTKYKLAQLTGLSQTTIANWLTGKTVPDKMKLELVAIKLGLPVDYFWSDKDESQITTEKVVKPKVISVRPRYGTGSSYRVAVRRYAQTKHRIEKLRTGLFSNNVTNSTLLECIKELTEENIKLHKQIKSMAATPERQAEVKRMSKRGPGKITG